MMTLLAEVYFQHGFMHVQLKNKPPDFLFFTFF